MATKIRMNELATLSGVPPLTIHNWLTKRRIPLVTEYAPALLGRAAEQTGRFTKANAMEITLIGHLVKGGMTPTAAAAWVGQLFDELERRKPFGWFVFFGDTGRYLCVDNLPKLETLRAMGVAATVVNVAELRAQVDKFFDEAS
jgi:hypothetical protein